VKNHRARLERQREVEVYAGSRLQHRRESTHGDERERQRRYRQQTCLE